MIEFFSGILATAFLAGGVLALGAFGEVLAERVGVINLGIEGLMALGGISAIITVSHFPVPWAGLLVAMIVGFLFGAMFAAGTVLLGANQTLCGLSLTILGSGLAAAAGRPFSGQPAKATFDNVAIPLLSKIPVVGESFFSQNVLLYIIWIVLPFSLHWLLFGTRHGLNMRAVGENPAAADAVGIPVTAIRFWYVTAGASLAAAAGGYLTLAFVPSWSDGIVAGRGWIAVALVIFAGYRPYRVAVGALLFGIITALGFFGQARNWPISPSFLSMLPYLGTIVFMIVPALIWKRMQRHLAAPASLGVAYFREQD